MTGPALEVDVVRARVADFHDLRQFKALLTPEESARADGYRVAAPRDAFILARGLLRLELGSRLGPEPGEIRFDLRASGKPDLRRGPDRPDIRFSVSHSGGHVGIAFVTGLDVGLDLERIGRDVAPLAIASRYFTPREIRSLEATPHEDRKRAFFAGWTRKEAIVKARGHTMAESLNTLTVDLDPAVVHPHYEDDATITVRPVCALTTFEFADEGLIGAVAVQTARIPRLRFAVVSGARFD